MPVIVRPAEGADIADIVALNRVVQSFHAAADPEFFRVDTEEVELQAFFGTLVSSEESVIFLAECEGRAAGYVWFEIQDRAETPFTRPMKRMNVHHLVVSEDTRRRGVGSALMDAAKARAVSRDVREIILNTWFFNDNAQAFFRTAGFEPFSIAMRRRLEPVHVCDAGV